MSILRSCHNKENPYTILNRKSLWDSNLSLEAVGLWARLMSRPDNWTVRTSELRRSCNVGKDKLLRLLAELIENGYAYRYQTRSDNKYGDWETLIFETKKSKEEIEIILTEAGFQAAENQAPEIPPLISNENNQVKKEKDIGAQPPSPPLSEPSEPCYSHGVVKIPEKEHKKLIEEFGEELVAEYIERIDLHCNASKPKGYKCYASVVRLWIKKDFKKQPKFYVKPANSWDAKPKKEYRTDLPSVGQMLKEWEEKNEPSKQ